jgi:hypothetical protein
VVASTQLALRACSSTVTRSRGGRAAAPVSPDRDGVVAVAGHGVDDAVTEHEHERGHHRGAPVGTAPLGWGTRLGLEHLAGPRAATALVVGVEGVEQRFRVGAYRRRDRADVPPRVEVAAAGREVVVLDGLYERAADAGDLGDLLDGQPCALAGCGQGLADGHCAAPPVGRSRRRANERKRQPWKPTPAVPAF